MRTILWVFAGVAMIASFCCSSGPGPAVQGESAPEFTFKNQSGKEFSLSQLRGKVVLVNFWGTFCPPCLDELPSMQQLHRRMINQPFEILALSVDTSWEPVNRFMKENGVYTASLCRFRQADLNPLWNAYVAGNLHRGQKRQDRLQGCRPERLDLFRSAEVPGRAGC